VFTSRRRSLPATRPPHQRVVQVDHDVGTCVDGARGEVLPFIRTGDDHVVLYLAGPADSSAGPPVGPDQVPAKTSQPWSAA